MSLLEHSMPLLNGEMQDLTAYAGKVVLIVNTASQCGFTYQYEGLETLWKDYADKGLVILGFPCNQFGKQEPGDSAEIGSFCQKNYGVSFPMFAKIEVNGANAAPRDVSRSGAHSRDAPGVRQALCEVFFKKAKLLVFIQFFLNVLAQGFRLISRCITPDHFT